MKARNLDQTDGLLMKLAEQHGEVDGNHGGMVPMVWPRIFEFFIRQGQTPPSRSLK